jgi:hypothetical protein
MKVLAEHHASPKSGGFGKSGEPLIDRAVAAYRSHSPAWLPGNAGMMEPSLAQVVEHDGKQYVILWRPAVRDSILRVYRVRAYDGILRVMKRWPRELYEPQGV